MVGIESHADDRLHPTPTRYQSRRQSLIWLQPTNRWIATTIMAAGRYAPE
jgi:hypothetical protein